MTEIAIKRLQFLCESIPQLLNEINEQTFSFKPQPDKWSKKEIVGHLIDSATNNHHRFVRGQFEETPNITYDQNKWNEYNFYNQIDKVQIVNFWAIYNRQILELIKNIPKGNFSRQCCSGNDQYMTLEFIFIGYVEHLEHHLKQVVDYK